MKIGIDIRPLNIDRKSGVEGYITNLLKSLFELDNKNEYKLFYNSFKKNNLAELNFDKKQNVKIHSFNYPNKALNFSLNYFRYPKIDKLIKGVDIFFQPNILFNSLSHDCKNVLTFHDLSFITHPKYYSWKRRAWHRLINAKRLAQRADGIIAVSKSTKNDLVEIFNINPDKIEVIHSGIDKSGDFNKIKQNKIMEKYNLPSKYFLYLGVLEPRKNIINIISAFEIFKKYKINDYKLVLAGSKGWLSKRIINKIKASKYKKDIILYGFVDEKLKKYLYQMANIFLFPSFYEGFGFPPLEAMAAGTPIITSTVSSLPEICGKAALYVDPYNTMELFKMILNICENNDLRENLIKFGNEQVNKFYWEKSAKKTLEFFKHINNR